MGPCNVIRVPWNVNRETYNVISGPWNVNRGHGIRLWDRVMRLWDREIWLWDAKCDYGTVQCQ